MLNYLRNIGKSLMIPIAVLPAAAILAGVGNWLVTVDVLPVVSNILFMAGTSILDNMAILFAVGIAFGLSKDKNGASVLPAVVMWFVVFRLLSIDSLVSLLGIDTTNLDLNSSELIDLLSSGKISVESLISTVQNQQIDLLSSRIGDIQALSFTKLNNAFVGILIGCISAALYNRLYKVELPAALSFFSGRRLVPIVAAIVGIFLALILFFVWPLLFNGLVLFGEAIVSLGAIGAGIYGFLNRLLIPTGLHHALNSVFWFDVAGINDIGNYLGCTADIYDSATQTCGDGIKGITGMYQAGFFPIMMFGLPAAALAIYKKSLPENRAKVGSIMLAGAFASFFTGVTEPIEFSFMFVAWPLYFVHALLTGLSLFIASTFQFINGFGFSAGLVDYVLNFANPLASKPLMLLVQGVFFAFLYYFIFSFVIEKFNLLTPGRTPGEFDELEDFDSENEKYTSLAKKILKAIGEDNLISIDNCATRLRLEVKNSEDIDVEQFKKFGIPGAIKPSNTQIQVIIGPNVEFVADELSRITKK